MRIPSRKPVIVAGAAAAAAGLLAVGVALSQSASAASPSPSARPSGAPSGWGPGGPEGPGERGGPGGPGGLGGHGGLRGQLLHGEEVVQQGTKVVTIEEQAGKVTAVSATSITVKSTDGYTATYVVAATTAVVKNGAQGKIADVKVGDSVRIEGTKAGSTVTATHLMDGLPPQPTGDSGRAPRPGDASSAPSPGGAA